MRKLIIVIFALLGLFLLFVSAFFISPSFQKSIRKIFIQISTNTQSKDVGIYLTIDNSSRKEISFTLLNNTDENIGIWPETCASQTVLLYKIDENEKLIINQREMICLLAPSPTNVKAYSSYSGKLNLASYESKLVPGSYILELSYGTIEERFRLTNEKVASSSVFIIN